MTTFTTDDREEAYKKIVAEAPNQPGYEDAVPMTSPSHIVDSGASVMKAKPVAYIDRQDLERLPHHDCWVNGQEHKNSVPLYTHPIKELTDKEINKIFNTTWGSLKDYMEFARAILKKAQEK